ncbi:uncharacterized protein LOC135695948 isoform X2 [Rhopilema esculentum]|uniref:uncharacterized protein LOC135695948 isoform X2 n=1 Tax=Rhopilema esculentum TaxID=499914 RepID=UPI0031CFD0F5
MANQLSSLCISLLTQLLDLNSLEGLSDDTNREGYVLKNIKTELGSDLGSDIAYEDFVIETSDHAEKKEKKLHRRLIKTSSKETNAVFGGKLNENSVRTMVKIMDHLKNHTEVEGLFRISGNKRRQEDLKDMLNKEGHSIDLTDKGFSQHDLTTILKQFLAELSEPLLTDCLYNCYKQVAEMDGKVSFRKRLTALQLLSLLLPPLNRLFFKKLVELLHLVSERTINLMTSKNLAVVFAPNIASRTKISCLNDVNQNLEPLTEIIEFIIENSDQIFKVPDELFASRTGMKGGNYALATPKAFCRRLNPRFYQQETVQATNDALADLYTQVVNMPDSHPMKRQVLEDFRKKYPGTPPFVPKCRRALQAANSAKQMTPSLKRKPEEDISNLSEDFDREDGAFLSTPEKRRLFTEGELAEHRTPNNRQEPSEQMDSANAHVFDTIPEKRKRFRRPSFSRPSFGFFSKRSTPDLRKLQKPPSEPTSNSSNNKRARSSSATNCDESDPKRRFSFTPFLDRKFNQQRSATEKKPPKKANKVSTYSKTVNKIQFEPKDVDGGAIEHSQCSKEFNDNSKTIDNTKKDNRPKPELRAPLMNIRSTGKPPVRDSLNIRRETLALHKEQKLNIDVFRPRRETLSIQRAQPSILPLKPRRENFDLEKGQPVLESFKPKRDSLIIHRKTQPQFEQIKSVQKDVYDDNEDNSLFQDEVSKSQKSICIGKENLGFEERCSHKEKRSFKIVDRDIDSPVKFTSFGKKQLEEENTASKELRRNEFHSRRMSTGSIMRPGWAQSKPLDEGYMVTYL